MPQGCYLGPLIFMMLINDLTAGFLLHKFVDDTTLTEIDPKDGSSNMSTIINDVISWSCKHLMNINWSKTKEMAIVTKGAGFPFDALSFSNNIVEQVHSFKLLGVTILKWTTHVNTICFKASSRLHFMKVLKRFSLSTSDLLYFYTSAVRPLLEYACPAWHTSLTSEQSKQIERIQIRALKIILNSNCIDYESLCLTHNLDTLSNRRNQLYMTFFEKSVLDKSGCLYYLLPPQRDMCDRLRHQSKFYLPAIRTARFSNSFIVYGLNNYL